MTVSEIPITALSGVGAKTAEKLARLAIFSVRDLLFHLPIRYEDRTQIIPIAKLNPKDHVLIQGVLQETAVVSRGKILTCILADETAHITLRFFHFYASQRQQLATPGIILRCFGEVRRGYRGGLEMMHPEYQIISPDEALSLSDLSKQLTPIYPTTKGLHQLSLRKLIDQALNILKRVELMELLPAHLLKSLQTFSLEQALHYVHRPPVNAEQSLLLQRKHPAQQRLAFEELVAHQLSLHQLRYRIRNQNAPLLTTSGQMVQQLMASLPFRLTTAQERVIAEIEQDMQSGKPMLRLVQGDVGSGKTIVAAIAALRAVEAGFQVALMAPTELLAEQHRRSFQMWLEPLQISIGWLTGQVQGKTRQQALKRIQSGEDRVIIGTHALFQDDVEFQQLALLIIDEQHRFGVHQRLALSAKGIYERQHPHQLVLTATPIPRTLAMAVYADLDCSVIDELPPGRKPITTIAISNKKRQEIIERVKTNCLQKKQAYWICTLIEESDVLQCQAAQATAKELQKIMPELKIELVHGRLLTDQKEAIMENFKQGDIDLLVATTVVEVGVDVTNASLMIIENPERLGLAQLHQLRGRIGRGSQASYCVLLYQSPLSPIAQHRLSIIRNSQDGFEIARQDLELRGPGEVLGTKQAGALRLKIADLIRDKTLLPQVQQAGKYIVQSMPQSIALLIDRWMSDSEKYMDV